MSSLVPERPCLYCRLSYAPDGSTEAVDRQEADGREMGARLRWPDFCCVYVDNSRSAWQRNRRRPDWDRMLTSLNPQSGHRHDGIMTYHGDRLIRQPYDLELLLNIADARQIPLGSVSGVRDLSNPDDRFVLRIEAAQACRESDNISRRVTRSLAARREQGLTQVGGNRPFGYGVEIGVRQRTDRETGQPADVPVHDTNQIVPGEAALLEEAVRRLLAGQSQSGVVRWLNGRCTTTGGGAWTSRGLRHLVLAPRIAGLIEHQGTYYNAAWPAIISRATREAVLALYARSAEEHPYPGRARRNLLSGAGGAAECGPCGPDGEGIGSKPSGGRNRRTTRLYYCRGCRRVGRNMEHLDRYVEGRTLALLSDPRLLTELGRADSTSSGLGVEIAQLQRRKADLRRQMANLADHPGLDPGLAVESLASFDRKITRLRAQLAEATGARLIARVSGIDPADWAEEPIDVRAAVIRQLFRVIIRPTAMRGPGFDPASVDVIRRTQSAG